MTKILLIVLLIVVGLGIFKFSKVTPDLDTRKQNVLATESNSSPRPTGVYSPKVLLLIYNPILKSRDNKKVVDYNGWNNPDTLTSSFIKDINRASHGIVNYTITQRIEINDFPIKTDSFKYTEDSYLDCVVSRGTRCHNPDRANYLAMINIAGACGKKNRGEIDELWIWGGPWFGYWESNLAGNNAFWYNSPPTTGSACQKPLPIMGFNYERGEAEMLHDMGHRLESVMAKAYRSAAEDPNNPWNKFSRRDSQMPNQGGCGITHFPVNASFEYGYSDPKTVKSNCTDFDKFPKLSGQYTDVNCSTWQCTQLGFFMWMFGNLPHSFGITDGKLNNWWGYIVDADNTL